MFINDTDGSFNKRGAARSRPSMRSTRLTMDVTSACSGNYAPDTLPSARAKERGYPVCLYLDASEQASPGIMR